MAAKRKYPAGIQDFESLRRDGYVYIDKTPLIYKMITEGYPYFLSRPRRFGKSLLVSTLEAIFLGKRELFEEMSLSDGTVQPQLFIARTDWQWEVHPVFRFDFSETNLKDFATLDEYIDSVLLRYEKKYDIENSLEASGHRFANLVRTAHQLTGQRGVVLIDEYDNQMLHAIGNIEKEEYVRDTFSALFSPLKSLNEHLRFIFITGITKFSQMGIFSTLNQVINISMQARYETICGISKEELTTQLHQDIEQLAQENNTGYDDMLERLKRAYDGYHFSEKLTDIYNPFSIINAFSSGELRDYWFSSATPSALIDMLAKMPPINLQDIDGIVCESTAFDRPFNSYQAVLPVLYQSGYLTIKDYDKELDEYTLGFPNTEVSKGFADCLYQQVTQRQDRDDKDKSQLLRAYKIFRRDDELPPFIEAIKAFFSGIPYQLSDKDKARDEHYYHALLYTLLMAFGADVTAEESTAKGRSDIVIRMPKGIYIFEIKMDKHADAALKQIDDKDYAGKYRSDGRPLTKVALCFSSQERNICEWESIPT